MRRSPAYIPALGAGSGANVRAGEPHHQRPIVGWNLALGPGPRWSPAADPGFGHALGQAVELGTTRGRAARSGASPRGTGQAERYEAADVISRPQAERDANPARASPRPRRPAPGGPQHRPASPGRRYSSVAARNPMIRSARTIAPRPVSTYTRQGLLDDPQRPLESQEPPGQRSSADRRSSRTRARNERSWMRRAAASPQRWTRRSRRRGAREEGAASVTGPERTRHASRSSRVRSGPHGTGSRTPLRRPGAPRS